MSTNRASFVPLLLLLLLLLCQHGFAQHPVESELRTWTSAQGTKLEGVLVKLKGDEVSIRTNSGRLVKVSAKQMSRADQTFLKDFRRAHRLPLVVAFVGGIDGYMARAMRELAVADGRELVVKEIGVHNLTNSDDHKRGKTVLRYGEDDLEEFLGEHKEGAERHIVLVASHSILAHEKLVGEYSRKVEKFQKLGDQHDIPLHVFDIGPLPENSRVRNFDDDGRTGRQANTAMEVFLKNLRGWDLISMPDVRAACAERLPDHSKLAWHGPLPDFVMSAVVYSAVTAEEPPLLKLKEEVLLKAGFEDPVKANSSNDGKLTHNITTTSNENLEAISTVIDKVVN